MSSRSPVSQNQYSSLCKKGLMLLLLVFPLWLMAQPQTNDEQLAIQYFTNREFEKAGIVFANLYEKRPDAYYYTYYLQCLIETQKYEEAEKLVKKHRKKNDFARFSVDLGYIYELSNETDKARKEYEKAIKDLPAEKYQITDLANAFNLRRHPDLAIETYKQGRRLLGNPYVFSIEIAQMYQTSGKIEPMMDEYLRLIEQNPSNAEDIEYRIQGIFTDDEKGEKYEIVRKSILKRAQKDPENMGYAVLFTGCRFSGTTSKCPLSKPNPSTNGLPKPTKRCMDSPKWPPTTGNGTMRSKPINTSWTRGPMRTCTLPAGWSCSMPNTRRSWSPIRQTSRKLPKSTSNSPP